MHGVSVSGALWRNEHQLRVEQRVTICRHILNRFPITHDNHL
jgi:hypothetical protein